MHGIPTCFCLYFHLFLFIFTRVFVYFYQHVFMFLFAGLRRGHDHARNPQGDQGAFHRRAHLLVGRLSLGSLNVLCPVHPAPTEILLIPQKSEYTLLVLLILVIVDPRGR